MTGHQVIEALLFHLVFFPGSLHWLPRVYAYSAGIYIFYLYICRSKLMVQCWAAKAEDRPTFCGIVTSLSQSLDMVSGYMELHKAEEETVI